jgi:hypothetical protein
MHHKEAVFLIASVFARLFIDLLIAVILKAQENGK